MKDVGKVATVELERHIASVCIVIGTLSYQKEPSPIFLVVINKNSKVLDFHYTILPLGPAISLRVMLDF